MLSRVLRRTTKLILKVIYVVTLSTLESICVISFFALESIYTAVSPVIMSIYIATPSITNSISIAATAFLKFSFVALKSAFSLTLTIVIAPFSLAYNGIVNFFSSHFFHASMASIVTLAITEMGGVKNTINTLKSYLSLKSIFGNSLNHINDLVISIQTGAGEEGRLLDKIQDELSNCANKTKIDLQDAILFVNCTMDLLKGSEMPTAPVAENPLNSSTESNSKTSLDNSSSDSDASSPTSIGNNQMAEYATKAMSFAICVGVNPYNAMLKLQEGQALANCLMQDIKTAQQQAIAMANKITAQMTEMSENIVKFQNVTAIQALLQQQNQVVTKCATIIGEDPNKALGKINCFVSMVQMKGNILQKMQALVKCDKLTENNFNGELNNSVALMQCLTTEMSSPEYLGTLNDEFHNSTEVGIS